MATQWRDELKGIQAAFQRQCGEPPLLRHALLVGEREPQKWWEQIGLKPTVSTTWSAGLSRSRHGKCERWHGCFWFAEQDGEALSYQENMVPILEHLNRLADGINDILAEQHRRIDCMRSGITCLPALSYNGGCAFVDWLFYVHDIAWSHQHTDYKAHRYQLCRGDSKVQTRRYDRVSSIVDDPTKLAFPHEYYCVLEPDVFTASTYALDVLITEISQVGKLPPRWSVPMTLKELAKALGVNDVRTVKKRYESALHKESRQAYRIDINAVAPSYQKNIRPA